MKSSPNVYGIAPGVNFPEAFVQGLNKRYSNETLASAKIYVNSSRMQKRIRSVFDSGPAQLLPQIKLITDIGDHSGVSHIPAAIPSLRRRLELTQLVSELLEMQPDLAPKAAIFDLADSLATLMDEMQSEGVDPTIIETLDVADQSGHWERSLNFLGIIHKYFGEIGKEQPDVGARQRMIVECLVSKWQTSIPSHPIIIAGSTGSRGATHLLMTAVAKLPYGAVVLPGFDFDLPHSVWGAMDSALTFADHPQYRFCALMKSLETAPSSVKQWGDTSPPNPARNSLISLALRPAPITDQWMSEGKAITDTGGATVDMSLVEAPSPRIEALAIAIKIRECVFLKQSVALVTPDRMLTRQVTMALDQWGIEPDDSAGLPLIHSAPGRLLLHVAGLFSNRLTAESLLTILKHPLTHSGISGRGTHLRWTRELELFIRKNGMPFPDKVTLMAWATSTSSDDCVGWMAWLTSLLEGLDTVTNRSLTEHLEHHISTAAAISAGVNDGGSGALWEKPAGQTALRTTSNLLQESEYGGILTSFDYLNLFRAILTKEEVRDPTRPHPDVMIWGALEARVIKADVVILSGLNDGIWPSTPSADPWMSRQMRQNAGLLLPERQIGLSAHDFQQSLCAKTVWLTRSIRDADAHTVPSRWLNRFTNLLSGLEHAGGKAAYQEMKARGNRLLQRTEQFEKVTAIIPSEPRPSPRPPVAMRPESLSVTRIKKLIRDPYAIYAEKILNLKPLNPMRQQPDAPFAGTVLHRIFERFIDERCKETHSEAHIRLMTIADEVLEADAPWPTARRIWRAKLDRVADWFLDGEDYRNNIATPTALEIMGAAKVGSLDFTLTAKVDRLDVSKTGEVYIYDYKTGNPPSKDEQIYFDKQLLLTAAIVERSGFKTISETTVAAAEYIGLGATPKITPAPLNIMPANQTWAELEALISLYQCQSQGYTSRRAMAKQTFAGDYDHLARFGEWDDSSEPEGVDVE